MNGTTRLFHYNDNDTLTLPARREEFATFRRWFNGIARELADEFGMSAEVRKQCMVAADEIFTNIAVHAYPETVGTVDVSVEFDLADRCLTMTFSDSGIPFDPLKATEPNLSHPMEERPIGGLGIHLVRQFMDSMEYRRENDRNILTLRKTIADA